MPDHFLDVKARPARGRNRIAAETEGVDADREAGLLCRFIDRPIAALAERLDIAAEQQYLREILIARALPDFGGRCRSILIGDHDGGLQPLVPAGPFLDLPVVDC